MVRIWSIEQEEWRDGGRERGRGTEDERERRGMEVKRRREGGMECES